MKKLLQSDFFVGLLLSLSAFVVYFKTLSPGICPYDCGELAAVTATLGVAHPSGYPLFTLLGSVFSHLPLGHRVIWNLNLLSALLSSAAVYFFYRLFLLLVSSEGSGKKKKVVSSPENAGRWAAAVSALVFAFSETYWAQATSIEVYALHLAFLSIVLLLFLVSVERPGKKPTKGDRIWPLFAFALGLSFTNHMSTVLLAPAFLYLFFAGNGFHREAWIKISRGVIPFLLGLSLYLYLPIRAALHPVMNWGDPVTFGKFFQHVSTGQYRYLMFSSWEVLTRQLKHFFFDFPSEFGYLPVLIALLGGWRLFQLSRRLWLFTLLLFASCVIYSANYDFYDTNSFFIQAYAATAIWLLFGIHWILESARKGWQRWTVGVLCASLVLFPLYLHYAVADESRDNSIDDYVENVLGSLDSGAVFLSDESEYLTSPFDYLQQVEHSRPDVIMLDCELLANPWYLASLEIRHPWLVESSRREVSAFLEENSRLTRHDPAFDSANLVRSYAEMVHAMLSGSYASHPVYITADIKVEYLAGFRVTPSGLVFKLFREDPAPSLPLREFNFRPLYETLPHNEKIRSRYAAGYVYQGAFGALTRRDTASAVAFMKKALWVKPDYTEAQAWLARLGQRP